VIQDNDKPLAVLLKYEHCLAMQEKILEERGTVSHLLAVRRLSHDPQRVLAAVHRLAFMVSERLHDFCVCIVPRRLIRLELDIAALTHADGRMVFLYNPKTAFRHIQSLAHPAERV
jgi:hypothetical protein